MTVRLAVVADIHGNRPALDAVVADMAGRNIDGVVNLGDCVSGPLWPRATLERLRELGWPTVRGNHDRRVGAGGPDLGSTDSFAANEVSDAGRQWLASLPVRLDWPGGWLAVHASPDDDEAYLLEDVVIGRLLPARAATVAARLGACAAPLVLTGHSHLAAVLRLGDGRWVVNPGSVGCPAYDDPTDPAHVSEAMSPSARYAILDGDPARPDDLKIALLAIPYDHSAAAHRAAALGRPDWAHALSHGTMTA